LHLSKSIAFVAVLAGASLAFVSCGSEKESTPANAASLDRVAWLGSAEGWGVLGLPLDGGPLAYLSAENLESPTWAPPELGRITAAWPAEGAIWVQFEDSRIGRYDYATGHLLSFDSLGTTAVAAVELEDGKGLVVAPDEETVELVAESEPWRVRLGGKLVRLESAANGWVVAVVDAEPRTDLVVLQPPEAEPLARLQTSGVRDLVVTAWGGRLYYLSEDDADPTVHGLSLPDLEEVEEILLPGRGRAIAVTPSGHRLYTAVERSLQVFDRLREQSVGEIALPGAASALRFSLNGANLLARLDGDRVAVLQVGIDSLLAVVEAEWDDNLPVALPAGRLLARVDGELVLYDIPRSVEVARTAVDDGQLWLAVKWQPPRPRVELARRTAARVPKETPAISGATGSAAAEGAVIDPDAVVSPGFYAVVLAARQRGGVEDLVIWLRSVGYPGVVDRHRDVMSVTWFRAMVGPYASRERAEAAAQELGARYGYKPWILRVDRPSDEAAAPADSAAAAGAVSEGDEGEEQGATDEDGRGNQRVKSSGGLGGG
jgi:SPOR domain